MLKKIIVSGLLGTLVLIIWTFISNGLLGFNTQINMKSIQNERVVYEVLRENITEPGRYICNPEVTQEMSFPQNEPVYSILYGGVGHESAGKFMIIGLLIFLLAPAIATWMLSQASEKVLRSYKRKVLFFVAIGLLFAVFSNFMNYGIGNYPLNDSIILAAHSIFTWTLVGIVAAWKMKID